MWFRWMTYVLGLIALAVQSSVAYGAVALASYKIAPNSVTVAGISSGAAMAVQLQVAYSKSFHGAAIIAGVPYYCAQDTGSNTWSIFCEYNSILPTLENYTNAQAKAGTIDPVSNLANKPIYMFSGTLDTTVPQALMNVLYQYYLNYTTASEIVYNNTTAAQHSWITPDATNACSYLGSPYMNNCGFDAEQVFLTQFYGPLKARNNSGKAEGSLIQFNQNAFCASNNCSAIGMASTAWTYVPASCASGKTCRIVVAVHGCAQNQATIGETFVENSGLNEWADTNKIIVLYPQTSNSLLPNNSGGCWDWMGYTNANYALKSGPQMKAIMAEVNQLTGGHLNP